MEQRRLSTGKIICRVLADLARTGSGRIATIFKQLDMRNLKGLFGVDNHRLLKRLASQNVCRV